MTRIFMVDLGAGLSGNDQINAKKLGAGVGVSATNVDSSHNDMRGIKAPATVFTLTGIAGQIKSIYRWGRDTLSDTAYWVGSVDDLDFARSMLAEDASERTYITGGGVPPRYFDAATIGTPPYPTATVALGVPTPSGAMSLALGVEGTGANESRVYLDTFVRANGDESAPNPSTATIVVKGGSTVAISSLASVPSGTHGITKRRIYVYNGAGQFQRCVEQLATLTTATDTGTRGAVLQTGGKDDVDPGSAWLTPPDDLFGLMEAWNGMMFGFVGKSYRSCFPYKPHAWPLKYERIVPDTVVGAAKWGQSVLLVTTGQPRVITGSSPSSLSDQPIFMKRAGGVSKRSIKGVGHGVCWASNDGLCYHGQRGTGILSQNFIEKATWRALTPAGIIGACIEPFYVGIYSPTKAFMIDTTNPVGVVWLDIGGYGVFEDSVSSNLYIAGAGNTIKLWEAGAALTAIYKTAMERTAQPCNAVWARIDASTFPVTLKLWADGVLVGTLTAPSRDPFRIPVHNTSELWQAEVSGVGPIEGFAVVSDIEELP